MSVTEAAELLREKFGGEPWFVHAAAGSFAGRPAVFVYAASRGRHSRNLNHGLPGTWEGYPVILGFVHHSRKTSR